MSKDIRIKKGLNINLVGAAEKTTSKAVSSNVYALNLDDFHGITPKMLVKEGEEVKAGEPLFYDKTTARYAFCIPGKWGVGRDSARGQKKNTDPEGTCR